MVLDENLLAPRKEPLYPPTATQIRSGASVEMDGRGWEFSRAERPAMELTQIKMVPQAAASF